MSLSDQRYTVELIRSGQVRPYGETVHEYKIHCEHFRSWGPEAEQGWHPALTGGDIDAEEAKAQAQIAAGKLKRIGGSDVQARKDWQMKWALDIARALSGRHFQIKGDAAYSGLGHNSLQWIKLDAKQGLIHFQLSEPWND